MIFNTFVFCQVFNELNARSIGDEMNVFKGLYRSPLFLSIIIFTVIAQYGIIEYGGDFVRTTHLTTDQWIKCILLGSLSLPLGGIMRLLPVRDSASDFAIMSDLIKTNRNKAMHGQISEKVRQATTEPGDGFSVSFFVWFIVVTILPVVVMHRFEEHWHLLPASMK